MHVATLLSLSALKIFIFNEPENLIAARLAQRPRIKQRANSPAEQTQVSLIR
jgi:hypothetical protein